MDVIEENARRRRTPGEFDIAEPRGSTVGTEGSNHLSNGRAASQDKRLDRIIWPMQNH